MKTLGIIPARFGSTRLPAKPLELIQGKSMISWTYQSALKCQGLDRLIVATDHQKIIDEVERFGGEAVMTSADHLSGTDRCLEAFEKIGQGYSHIINIQGDEPFIPEQMIQSLIDLLKLENVTIATLAKEITDSKNIDDPNRVKVVFDSNKKALYFSRSRIPFDRKGDSKLVKYFKHIGLYGYSAEVLKEICKLQESTLEKTESLEQLRWLENGHPIHIGLTDLDSPSIDTKDDLERIRQKL